MMIRNKIIDVLRRNFEKYGYLPLETPTLNYYELLSYKYSDDAEILSEINLTYQIKFVDLNQHFYKKLVV